MFSLNTARGRAAVVAVAILVLIVGYWLTKTALYSLTGLSDEVAGLFVKLCVAATAAAIIFFITYRQGWWRSGGKTAAIISLAIPITLFLTLWSGQWATWYLQVMGVGLVLAKTIGVALVGVVSVAAIGLAARGLGVQGNPAWVALIVLTLGGLGGTNAIVLFGQGERILRVHPLTGESQWAACSFELKVKGQANPEKVWYPVWDEAKSCALDTSQRPTSLNPSGPQSWLPSWALPSSVEWKLDEEIKDALVDWDEANLAPGMTKSEIFGRLACAARLKKASELEVDLNDPAEAYAALAAAGEEFDCSAMGDVKSLVKEKVAGEWTPVRALMWGIGGLLTLAAAALAAAGIAAMASAGKGSSPSGGGGH